MKKLVLAFGFLIFTVSLVPAEAEVINYWDYWQNKGHVTNASAQSAYARPSYTTRRTTTEKKTTTTRNTNTRSRWASYLRNKRTNTQSRRSSYSSITSVSRVVQEGVKANVRPITLRQDINDITQAPVDLFQIGLSHNASGRNFTEAVNIDEMRFQITDNTGVVSDFSDFSLTTEDQDFDFDSRGFVTLRFLNLRLAKSENKVLDIGIKIEDPDSFPRLPGSFRVKLTGITAYKELSGTAVKVQVSGRSASDYIVLNPRPGISGGGTSIANITGSQVIAGRPLGGGEKAFLLSLTLGASYDDFLLESLSVTNQHGSNVDQLVKQINLVDLGTGKVLDSTRFVGGKARFDMNRNKQLFIPRTGRVKLGLEVQIVSNPKTDSIDNRLTMIVTSNDVELYGVGAGKNVPNSQKNISLNAKTFTVSKGTLTAQGGIYFSSDQPIFFTTKTLNQVARFKIVNAGTRDLSFGRFSLQVVPNGVAFVNGGTTADLQLVELFNGVTQFPRFTTTSVSSNIATFDATSEIYIDAGQTREFALLAALENTGSNSDSDGISIILLGDSTLSKGTLSSVRGAGSRFIWSDHSGAPHTPSSNDWLSGFQFPGVPTNAFVNTRK